MQIHAVSLGDIRARPTQLMNFVDTTPPEPAGLLMDIVVADFWQKASVLEIAWLLTWVLHLPADFFGQCFKFRLHLIDSPDRIHDHCTCSVRWNPGGSRSIL